MVATVIRWQLERTVDRYRRNFLGNTKGLGSIDVVGEQSDAKVVFHADSSEQGSLASVQEAAGYLHSLLLADHGIDVPVEAMVD